jgi:hypothetical protein
MSVEWSTLRNLLGFKLFFCEHPILAGFDTWWHQVIQRLAEWIVTFATTNVRLKLVLLVLNIPLYFLLGRLLFGSWDRFLGVLRKSIIIYILGPFMFLFYHRRERVRSALVSRQEIGLSTLVDTLWVGLYTLEYLSIKAIFL